jgi:hypothetical protein
MTTINSRKQHRTHQILGARTTSKKARCRSLYGLLANQGTIARGFQSVVAASKLLSPTRAEALAIWMSRRRKDRLGCLSVDVLAFRKEQPPGTAGANSGSVIVRCCKWLPSGASGTHQPELVSPTTANDDHLFSQRFSIVVLAHSSRFNLPLSKIQTQARPASRVAQRFVTCRGSCFFLLP